MDRPLRRDAQRNRDLLVAAAREVFGSKGLDAPLEEIARRAGVAIGTLYNRFPARVNLIEAAFLPQLEQVLETGAQALALEDAWAGLVYFVETSCERQSTDRGFAEVCSGTVEAPEIDKAKTAIWEMITALVGRAQDAGELRQDFEAGDLVNAIAATSSIPDWRRHLTFLLDGFRAK
ncbi:TetR/AcrR family transcriptional regulator [Amycolatopsis xylanica]|uniref:TetR/AcrR family transcriptional regulator n=1 Tax=Amycolatopsis xylanica TaxID=589385 RepID=UPI001FE0B6CB|nr:TetR/AcrR family transcriptional regulator [Amycolatopsis xylanica]